MNLEQLKYTEVKSMMSESIISIGKNRDKVWQLIGIFFAVQSFLITDIFNSDFFTLKSLCFYVSIYYSIVIYKLGKVALFPSHTVMNGMELSMFKDNHDISDVTDYYDRAAVHNDLISEKIIIGYKKCFNNFMQFIYIVSSLVAVFLIIEVSKIFFCF